MKTKANQSAAERNITMVALANIQPSGFNPRKRFDETSLYELAESIKRQGVLQPITVRPVDGTDRYGIVFGERRYRADLGGTLRKERELHPHTAEIHRPYPRNRRPLGCG